ncbi:MAG: ribonucleoside-diphosphate reductase, adenosylcobalamin-dependent [Lentisphaerae bacterium GWF2_52_8]|nr:MAG: ribonucleoside-diphosphate reductase, adenosylcobalamin-dependent [Lentisphaerae bacterium GWF2_52_8]
MSKKETSHYDISADIWNRKYRYQGCDGLPGDMSISDSFLRVARACATDEKDSAFWEKKFADILADFRFMPGGRILANAGTARKQVTMFNCYVMNTIEDSIEGIFDTVKESALTQKQGGGVGFDFSTIRPAGSQIRGCEAESSGPISFMQVLDSTCRTIMSAGQRRGAQMGVMRCDHPDIEQFITAKRSNAALQMFNLSVGITEKFIRAVKENKDWELVFNGDVYKTIHATDLWELIMRSTYDAAEPGFILIDKINEMNNLYYAEEIRATNPCGEQPLPPYGACLLGSLNLTKFVKSPFTPQSELNYSELEAVTRVAVRLLDNVINMSNYPLQAQRNEAMAKRRMGIGITGLADLFIFMGVRYGSPEAVGLSEKIMKTITCAAYESSVALAKEKGAFPLFAADKYCEGKFIRSLPVEIQRDIHKHGIRNSHLTSIAPTGTISLLADNVSSGLEPVFAFKYTRKIRNGAEHDVSEVEVTDHAYAKYREFLGKAKLDDKKLPHCFVTAEQITPDEHLDIQAALQKYVDSSISKTINVPTDYPYEDFKNIYLKAYEKGLKGCTTFRPSDQIKGVLVRKEDAPKAGPASQEAVQDKIKRPRELEGTTYKIKTPLSADALYVTINDLVDDEGRHRPYELFINTKNLQHFSWIVAMTRLISAVFRHDPEPRFLVDELKSIYDPSGGYFSEGSYVPSLAADIGRIIEKHLNKLGIMGNMQNLAQAIAHEAKAPASGQAENGNSKLFCPYCREKALIAQENCLKCLSCGYSKCG